MTLNESMKGALKNAATVFLLACCFCMPFWLADVWSNLSQISVFNQIDLGTRRSEVVEILRAAHIQCAMTDLEVRDSASCEFSDYWRTYYIRISRETGLVAQKGFALKHHKHLFAKLADFVSPRR